MTIIDINGTTRECLRISPDAQWPGYMKIEYASRTAANGIRSEWYPKQDFLKNNPELTSAVKDAKDLWKEDLGAVSLASTQTLTDKSKTWQSNEFAGYPLWISRGTGEGQTKTILMNTNDTLIIDSPWDVIPDKSSQYVISHNVHDPQVMGNTLPTSAAQKKVPKKKKEKNK